MAAITDLSQLDPNGVYSYADYLTWRFEQAVELVNGHWLKKTSPNRKHQDISMQLSVTFLSSFKGQKCKVYAAPFDVRLPDKAKSARANKDVLTVVQPDLCIICDLEKLDERGCVGAPDLVVEILSVGNSKKEMRIKKSLYEENGVNEYWIIDPDRETLLQYVLQEDGVYSPPAIFMYDERVQSAIFPFLNVELMEIFEHSEEVE